MVASTLPPRRDSPITGLTAAWYARLTKRDMQEFCQLADRFAAQLPAGSRVLEVAPGPGYWAIELTKRGAYKVVGLDLSADFVRMARENARQAGVVVDFQQGNAAAMPLPPDAFDFILCRAAFKNFAEPLAALDEMHRVLKPGGQAVIIDLRNDASFDDIRTHVAGMNLGIINRVLTRFIFKHMLLKRAYNQSDFENLAGQSRFGACEIRRDPIGLEVWLAKHPV